MNQYVTGTVIKNLREQHNMTQSQLSMRLGVSAKTVSKWEKGNAEARFKIKGVKKIYFYCNRNGLFVLNLVKRNKNDTFPYIFGLFHELKIRYTVLTKENVSSKIDSCINSS